MSNVCRRTYNKERAAPYFIDTCDASFGPSGLAYACENRPRHRTETLVDARLAVGTTKDDNGCS